MLRKSILLFTLVFSSILAFATGSTIQTISFTAIPNKLVNAASFAITATASSGLPVTFTVTSGTSIASVSGNMVTLSGTAAGAVTIRASQGGDATYAAAASVSRTFSVSKLTNTITFTSITNKYVDDPAFMAVATATDGTVTFSGSNPAVATVASDGTITPVATGSITVTAFQSGSDTYSSARASRSFSVIKHSNTITYSPPASMLVTAMPAAYVASSTYGTPTYTSSNSSILTVAADGTITPVAAGTATITAAVSATATYNAATITKSVVIKKNTNTINFPVIPGKYVTDPAFVVIATATDGAVTFSGSNAAVATVAADGTITPVSAGTITVTATQAGSATFTSATATRSLIISKLPNTITFNAFPVKYVTDPAFMAAATVTDGTLTYSGNNAAVATVAPDGTITPVAAGTVSVTATQSGSATYNSAVATRTLTISKLPNAISFPVFSTVYVTDPAFMATATATNGTVSYSGSNPAIATVASDGTITPVAAGSITVTATQAGSATYVSATASRLLTISKLPNTITFAAIPNHLVTDPAFMVVATATDGAVTFSGTNPAVATVAADGTITPVAAGTVVVKATQAGSATYASAIASRTLTITKVTQTISWTAIPDKITTDPDFMVSATASGGGAVTYSVVSGPATISGSTVSLTGSTGVVRLRAMQAGDATYYSKVEDITFNVNAVKIAFGNGPAIEENQTEASRSLSVNNSSLVIDQKIIETTLYPNPVKDAVFISGKDNFQRAEIYNAMGMLVKQISFTDFSQKIEMGNLPNGAYTIVLISENGVCRKRICKE